ncbi:MULTISPECIES: response regulator [Flavobacterium]|uniref:Response regulator n=1 Tax=Flavobacterium gawalongense TaxID=2594432 RepID=A0A553BRI0_9FLAO|nr:response regulator [Flavobacterium gawalongense]TRX03467.1 response regulator [Flavobacterium gawalongense]TRX06764.1 response regulator [Flavobacterium gawalongense]TRX10815.1 response regulator [Flavobacterium gawalongense]TRX11537.1 response regulator [Flavobacterium gawalongense]TRX29307.1 response regulator [Flavobacterium gawalongense]
MRNSNILLVDSCKADFENVKKAFNEIDVKFTLHVAQNDTEAWLMLQGDNKISPIPKIVLIDINEESVNGINLLNKIRIHPDLKSILVFVITRTDNERNKAAALNLNIAGYMHKPDDSKKMTDFFSILNDYWNIIEFSSEKK